MARRNEGQMKMDVGTGVRIPRQARNDGTGERISRSARNDSLGQGEKRGSVGVSSHAPNCGYDERTVRSLQERGWHMYRDGEKVW